MALTGWRLASDAQAPARSNRAPVSHRLANTEAMASFIAEHCQEPIGVNQASSHAGLHPKYAMTLVKQVLGMSISAYLRRYRLSHVQGMLLRRVAASSRSQWTGVTDPYADSPNRFETTDTRRRVGIARRGGRVGEAMTD